MQIHEIFRRNTNEGPLKNVASAPVNFGRTTAAMPQQSVAPSKVSYAPNMLPKAAPVATTGTNLAVVPQTTALPRTPSTGVATVPTGSAVTAAPKPRQVAPATSRTNQYDPNVIDVDAKDITNRRALPATTIQPAPAPAPALPGPEGGPADQDAIDARYAAKGMSPEEIAKSRSEREKRVAARTARTAPAAAAAPAAAPAAATKPAGLTPADMEKLRAKGTVQPATQAPKLTPQPAAKPAATVPNKTPKAGFIRNAAEYFANRTMNAAGIPQDQQGEYHPGGHQAALQGRSYGFIQKQEQSLADRLSSEWINDRTLAGQSVKQINADEIQAAADTLNRSSVRPLNVNLNAVTQATEKMIADKQVRKQAQQKAQLTKAAQQKIDVANQIKKLRDELKMPNLSKADARTKLNAILAQTEMLKSLGENPFKIPGLADVLTTTGAQKSAAPPVPAKTTPAERKYLLDLLGPDAYAALGKQGKL
jgi:hypothetical protein